MRHQLRSRRRISARCAGSRTRSRPSIRGKPEAIRASVVALLARGHLLIEDIPGVGKTTLARALAAALGGTFRRIQFTSDLLPSDIVGVSVYDQSGKVFELKRGPIFANVVLADEINRTTPRTQSALLEAMSEGQVSIDDATHELDAAVHGDGDAEPGRALRHVSAARVADGPVPAARSRSATRRAASSASSCRSAPAPIRWPRSSRSSTSRPCARCRTASRRSASTTRCSTTRCTIVEDSRRHPAIAVGVSTRGALAWYRAAQAAALAAGRDFVIPDDLKSARRALPAHRLVLAQSHDSLGRARTDGERLIADLVGRVPVPT